MVGRAFRRGDPVVFTEERFGLAPGPGARNVSPARHGDGYRYQVLRYWVVVDARQDGTLMLRAPRGECRLVAGDDPRLRPPTLWELLRARDRFPRLAENGDDHGGSRTTAPRA